ncbi:MAG: orotidine 5'-phosphate decarboxylase [Legionellales bacterium RIFCSPHIGHO2_12_FULL_35_11]|nr:MAG: orotidine 5'-phosphate decarboxylase [Legionellales bacterium RIFCSPHIGHO2_12_FULL_35_11]
MKYNLIVALDFSCKSDALALVDKLDPDSCALKIGSEMYTSLGPSFVQELVARRFKVFLDLKYHDIPTTVAKACAAACDLGIWMINLHASGGLKMMEAARKAVDAFGSNKPILIAVTVLTSMQSSDLTSIGIAENLENHVGNLAKIAKSAGLDGVVSSAVEVPLIKEICGNDFLTVTPGIRLATNNSDDQERVMTPKMALALGSDYLVVGRPITKACDPQRAIKELFEDV